MTDKSHQNLIGLVVGQTSPLAADVHAIWCGDDPDEPTLTGHVYGPLCEHAQTLPAKCLFRHVLDREHFVGTSFIPDPCYWTPAAPYYYQARFEVEVNGTRFTVEQEVGLRALAARGGDLWLSSKRWVLRGIDPTAAALGSIADWHEVGAAMVIDQPDDGVLQEASRQGVLLIVDLSQWVTERAVGMLAHLARWAAVAVVILPDDVDRTMLEPSVPFSYVTTNLLLAQRFEIDDEEEPIEPANWADVAICRGTPAEIARRSAYCDIPVLAQLPASEHADLASARRACDLLQRDLAPYRDYAGYLV